MPEEVKLEVNKNSFLHIDIGLPCTSQGLDPDNNSLLITEYPKFGALEIQQFSGKILYVPEPNCVGLDSFKFTLFDNLAQPCGEQLVIILIKDNAWITIDDIEYCGSQDANIRNIPNYQIVRSFSGRPRSTCINPREYFEWEGELVFETKQEAEAAHELLSTKGRVTVSGSSLPTYDKLYAFVEIPTERVKMRANWWFFNIKVHPNDGVPKDPVDPPTVGPEVHYKANSSAMYVDIAKTVPVSDGADIAHIDNIVEDQYHATQTSALDRMLYDSSTWGIPTIYNTGQSQGRWANIQDGYIYANTPNGGTFFVVAKPGNHDNIERYQGLFGWKANGASSSARYLQTDRGDTAEIRYGMSGSGNLSIPKIPNNWVIFSGDYDGISETNLYINGRLVGTQSGGAITPVDPLFAGVIGALPGGSSVDSWFEGWVLEWEFYGRKLTTDEHNSRIQEILTEYPFIKTDLVEGSIQVDQWVEADELVYQDELASVLATVNGQDVKNWSDKSGWGRGFFNGSAGNIASFQIVDGISTVEFNNDLLYHLNYNAFRTLFILVHYDDTTGNAWRSLAGVDNVAGGGGAFHIRVNRADTGELGIAQEGRAFIGEAKIQGWYLLTFRQTDGAGHELFLDAVKVDENLTAATPPAFVPDIDHQPVIGAFYFNHSLADWVFNTHIASWICTSEPLSDEDLDTVFDHYRNKYGSVVNILPFPPVDPLTDNLELEWNSTLDVYQDVGKTTPANLGSLVAAIGDQTVNSVDALQANVSFQGQLQAIDGINAILFNGTSAHYSFNYVAEPVNIYFVLKPTDTGLNGRVILGCNSPTSWSYVVATAVATGTLIQFTRNNLTVASTSNTTSVNTWHILNVTYNPTTLERRIYVDNVLQAVNTTGGTLDSLVAPAVLGALPVAGVIGNHYQGYMSNTLYYSTIHSDLERAYNHDALRNRWSTIL